jgi:predicted CXXCH cytochrome family protein
MLLFADPVVIEHLKPTAPGYEIAGMLAFIGLVILVLPAENSVRYLVWKDHRSFQATHVIITCLTILAIAVHVVGTDRYMHGRAARIAIALLCIMAWLSLLRPRTSRPGSLPARHWLGALVFGRHSRLIASTVLVVSVAMGALSGSRSAIAVREPLISREIPLPLSFPHDRHRSINCIACHHNYVDRRGMDSCISCHRSHADIQVGIEARFHDFCLGCHRDPPNPLKRSGPTTGCVACHHR